MNPRVTLEPNSAGLLIIPSPAKSEKLCSLLFGVSAFCFVSFVCADLQPTHNGLGAGNIDPKVRPQHPRPAIGWPRTARTFTLAREQGSPAFPMSPTGEGRRPHCNSCGHTLNNAPTCPTTYWLGTKKQCIGAKALPSSSL